MNRRVLVGMSGGIDSTASCHILMNQGYEAIGLTIRNVDIPSRMREVENFSPDYKSDETNHQYRGITNPTIETTSLPSFVIEARQLAEKLGIEHHVADEREAFQRDVVTPFLNGYLSGITPNPCVECNPLFKFRVLRDWADKLDCDYIATGHYARLINKDGIVCVSKGLDATKDQSYFLWRLGQDILKRTLFPLGDMKKSDVRQYLAHHNFEVKSHDTESMEICFIEKDYRDLLRSSFPDIDSTIGPGKFVDSEGKVIGTHKGYPFYTIGQRKGLVVAFGKPVYVLRTNASKNTVMLGQPEQLETSAMFVEESRFAGFENFSCESDLETTRRRQFIDSLNEKKLSVRIRYRSRAIPCILEIIPGEERLMVRFKESASAVTPGQSAVFYVDDMVVGGSIIASQRGINQYISITNENTDTI